MMSAPAPNSQPAPRPVFAIFQGGGAAGIAHLGAAAAAEDEGLEFAGVAGASAGAFVAALLAAGYRGKELFNPETRGSDLLSRYGKSPLDLLGAARWQEAVRVAAAVGKLRPRLRRPASWMGWIALAWHVARTAWPHRRIIGRALADKGHFDTAGVREFVNWAIHEKLRDAYAAAGEPENALPQRVCFRHLDVNKFPQFRPLKIIATDVQAGQAALFSSQDQASADVEIAAAVAASIAIPGFFRPVAIPGLAGRLFADGGLVSNLPTWTLLEDKLAYERRYPEEDRVPVVAFVLEGALDTPAGSATPATRPDGQPSLLAYLESVIRAGIFGSQAISQRLATDLVRIPIRPALGVLGFDAGWRSILECFNSGRRDAKRAFARSLLLRPERVRSVLKETVKGFERHLGGTVPLPPDALFRLRGAIIAPAGSSSLRVMITYGARTEADDTLLLDRDGPGCAAAFRDRDIKVVAVGHDAFGRPQFSPAALMTRYEAALLWPGLRSMVCVPIFTNAGDWSLQPRDRTTDPIGILAIDSDIDLAPACTQDGVRDWLAVRSIVMSQILETGIW